LRALLRVLFVIPFSFVASTLAAGGFIVVVVFATEGDTVVLPAASGYAQIGLMTLAAAVAVATFSFVPVLLFLLFAEVFAWRSVIVYLLAGLVVGLAALALIVPPSRAIDDAPIFLSAGAVAGGIYWFLAGRNAGLGPHERG
jgi:hypothetical protein